MRKVQMCRETIENDVKIEEKWTVIFIRDDKKGWRMKAMSYKRFVKKQFECAA